MLSLILHLWLLHSQTAYGLPADGDRSLGANLLIDTGALKQSDVPSIDATSRVFGGSAHAHAIAARHTALHKRSSSTPLRGVNIGNWLVLEKWMDDSGLFASVNSSATDQWTFDGSKNSKAKLVDHWLTYFTEADVARIQAWGLNALRIPIGYWAFEKKPMDPYHEGAQDYLDKAITWAAKRGMKVLIDLHGVPGSQNGFDNSGRSGVMNWQKYNNRWLTSKVLEIMTQKYGTAAYADTVLGIQMVNEPASWGNNDVTITKKWTRNTYRRMQNANKNPNLNIVMHDSFTTPWFWRDVGDILNQGKTLATSKFWIDTHLYQNQVAADSQLDQAEHIKKACNWKYTDLLPKDSTLPVIVGEFSAQTNICALGDGKTSAGFSCSTADCQCSATTAIQTWKKPLKNQTRRFIEAQLDTFESSTLGWFIWSYKGPGAWSLSNLMQYGIMGPTVNDRQFPGQCN